MRNGEDFEAATTARLQPRGARTGLKQGADLEAERPAPGSEWSGGRESGMERTAVGVGRKAASEE